MKQLQDRNLIGAQTSLYSGHARKIRRAFFAGSILILASHAPGALAWDEFNLSGTRSGNRWLDSHSASAPNLFSTWFGKDHASSEGYRPDTQPGSASEASLTSLLEGLKQESAESLSGSILQSPDWSFSAGTEQSALGIHSLRLKSSYKGVPVIGGRVSLIAEPVSKGAPSLILQEAVDPFDLSVVPTISSAEAAARASSYLADYHLTASPKLRVLVAPAPTPARLIWVARIHNFKHDDARILWMDAHRGEWIAAMPVRLSLAPIQVYQANPECQTIDAATGAPTSLDLSKCYAAVVNTRPRSRTDANGSTLNPDSSALQAAANSKRVLQYYLDRFGRDSYDARGSQIINVVHIGKQFDNAYWDTESNMMAYGDGDGVTTGDFTLGVDVAGHEMTHGVVSATANFASEDEPGALNEAYADFFGKMIENEDNWTIGKKLFLDPAHAEGFRDLKNPASIQYTIRTDTGKVITKPYPATVAEKVTTRKTCDDAKNDMCFVHINATIPGHGFYLMTARLGKQATEQIVYSALTHYLSETADFSEHAKALRTACKKLYPSGDTCAKLDGVLTEVGFSLN